MDCSKVNSILSGVSEAKLAKYVKVIAGNTLAECRNPGIDALRGVPGLASTATNTGVEEIDSCRVKNLEWVMIDAYSIANAESGSEVNVFLDNSEKLARILHLKPVRVDCATAYAKFYGNAHDTEEFSQQDIQDEEPDIVWDDEDVIESHTEEAGSSESVLEDVSTGDINPEESTDDSDSGTQKSKLNKELENAINRYYAQFANGVIQELLKRYTAMFASGYEVTKPAGVLCNDGIVKVSGSERAVYEDSISTTNIYSLLKGALGFVEVPSRSITDIANAIYDNFTSGRLLYFPNKMLEFAYGLEAPTGDRQESLKTYTRHAKASNWSTYCSSELEKSVKMLVRKSMYWYVIHVMEGDDYRSQVVASGLSNYLQYMQDCLSTCILFTEYKITNANGERDVASFKLRVCDPQQQVLSMDITPNILSVAFMGGQGKVPFSYPPRVEPSVRMVEYCHEFNHDLAQATPLFAYKALENLMSDGKSISWDNLILGQGEDGKTVKGGQGGIDLLIKLFHHITAGSRAGKGVMTLNLLASAAASRKSQFYIDRKPDMASILKAMSPNMFIFNGGGYEAQYDTEKQWTPELVDGIATANVPDEVYTAFGVSPCWDSLGDLFYMRALKLVIGIIIARGSGKFEDEAFGGKGGIMVVLDEFKNFQNSFRGLLKNASGYIPSTVREKALTAVEDGKMSQVTYDRYYSNAGYYALSYMNSLVADMNLVSAKQDAGFNQSEIALSDVFIIGQDVENGPMDKSIFSEYFRNSSGSGRYRMMDNMGVKGFNIEGMSVPYTLINFKPADAFFGRNMDDGHSVYLAQTDPKSRAYGRLDDKASNFAFMESYTEDKRKKILDGRLSDNVELANSCKYFKPYLILNDSRMDGDCVQGVFRRCKDNAGITPDEIIAQNPDNDNPSIINKAVGFLDYIKMAGVDDYESSFAKGALIAQHVVDLLGYSGSWFEFLCDLRPEWMFTIKDIDDVAKGKIPDLANPATNPILEEFVAFNPGRFESGYVGETEASENAMDDGLFTEDFSEDFSDEEAVQSHEDERMADLFGDTAPLDSGSVDEELDLDLDLDLDGEDLFGSTQDDNASNFDGEPDLEPLDIRDIFEEEQEAKTQQGTPLEESHLEETGFVEDDVPRGHGFGSSSPEEDTQEQILSLLRQLEALGVNIQVDSDESPAPSPSHSSQSQGPVPFSQRRQKPLSDAQHGRYAQAETSEFGEEMGNLQFDDDIMSLEKLMEIVSRDVVTKFGGLDRITSFKVIGGSIIVNGYYYKCRIKDIFARNIPYDIRKDINSGNISKLFNYFLIYKMRNIRSLEFDSASFTYDYVSSEMGISANIGVDRFFDSLPSLQVLTIENRRFTRSNFINEADGDDLFYRPRRITKIADASEQWLGSFSKSSWNFTKQIATNRNCRMVTRVVGTVGGATATVASGSARLGSKAARGAIKGVKILSRGIRDLFDN